MLQYRWFAMPVIALALVTAACSDDDNPVAPPTADNFTAALTGAKERPTPNSSTGQATASFTISADDNTLTWSLTNMTGTNNVFSSHIHVGGTEVAGPVAFGLFSGPKANNPSITGSVTRAAFPPESALGITFDALLSLMRSGDTYINVHTDDGLPPGNTGPGDFPGGEIRGQITLVP
jgi:hypothetical protein